MGEMRPGARASTARQRSAPHGHDADEARGVARVLPLARAEAPGVAEEGRVEGDAGEEVDVGEVLVEGRLRLEEGVVPRVHHEDERLFGWLGRGVGGWVGGWWESELSGS